MALAVNITRTIPLFPTGVFVQWDIADPSESGAYIVSLYRSGSAEGPWDLLMPPTTNTFCYTDKFTNPVVAGMLDPSLLSISRGLFYKVEVVPPSGVTNAVHTVREVESELEGKQRLVKRKILRDEAVMLERLNGVPMAVLKRRHWGTRCPKCYDKYTKEVVRGNCSNCFGTSFVGGYWEPVFVYGKRGTGPNTVGMTAEGVAELAVNNVTMLDLPYVQDDDLLVFLKDNRRFVVKRVAPTELRTVTVHQRVEVSELARTDIAYRIKIDPTRVPKLF